MSARVRPAIPRDLEAIVAIERHSFGDPWSLESFRASLSRTFVRMSVAEDAGAVLGYAVVWVGGDECELANLAVDPARRGQGIGALLLGAAMEGAGAEGLLVMFLEVRASNVRAQQLYARHGFHEVGRRPRYYTHPEEDALILRRDLG